MYDFEEHCHRFSCWTAARAASTGRFSNNQIEIMISAIKLNDGVNRLREDPELSHETYKEWFIKKVEELRDKMEACSNMEGQKSRKFTFGIAAKVVSIYIKTYEIIPSKGKSELSKYAFPPIDSILLKNVNKKWKDFKLKTNWSTMEREKYMALVEKLKPLVVDRPFWQLEEFWILNKNKSED